MVAWREVLRSVGIEGARFLLAWGGEAFTKTGQCKRQDTEVDSCISALKGCLASKWELTRLAEEGAFLNHSLHRCHTQLQDSHSTNFSSPSFCILISYLIFGLLLGWILRETCGSAFKPKTKTRAVKGKPVSFVGRDLALLSLGSKDAPKSSSTSSTSSQVARARARARALQG